MDAELLRAKRACMFMSFEIRGICIGRNFEISTWYSKRNECTQMKGVRMLKI